MLTDHLNKLMFQHGVVVYREDTYCKKVVFHLSALKPKALVAFKAPRGHYDFDKPENITGIYRQSNLTKCHLEVSDATGVRLKCSRFNFLPSFNLSCM